MGRLSGKVSANRWADGRGLGGRGDCPERCPVGVVAWEQGTPINAAENTQKSNGRRSRFQERPLGV
jgi:hypothetical protein